jgi:protein-L-isoaspartate(D-aspartate) O-methyltransferase
MTASSSVRLRRVMVASLEASRAIRSESVRDAFLAVRREYFVPELATRDGLAAIYRPDVALTTATDNRGVAISSSSAPAIMAPMLEALQLEPGQRVLEIGAGTGYNAALVKHLVGPRGRVTTVDLETAFARRARQSLAAAGYAARVVVGDGRAGWVQGAPYDRVIVTASAGAVYRPWLDQLVEGGLIEMPLRLARGLSYQVVATFERQEELLSSTTAMTGFFMPLRAALPDKSEERTYKWDGTESASPSLSASTSGPGSRVLASIEGPYLARLSTTGWRRALATLLAPARTAGRLTARAGGLVGYLLLRGRGPLCYCVVDGHWGAAVLSDNGASIATITRDDGGTGRIRCFGNESALRLLQRYQDEWSQRGSPIPNDLRLAVRFGGESPGRSWRRMRLGPSVVSIDWRRKS